MQGFFGNLDIRKIDERNYQPLSDLLYESKNERTYAARCTQPDGMPWQTFNGASIPRFFWRVIGSPFTGKYTAAALLHDYFYQFHQNGFGRTITRAQSDALFLEMMTFLGVSRWRRTIMYMAVRVGGGRSWR